MSGDSTFFRLAAATDRGRADVSQREPALPGPASPARHTERHTLRIAKPPRRSPIRHYNTLVVSSPSQAVQATVAQAARLRRARSASRHLWRVAPSAAGLCAVLAAGTRWAGWPIVVPLAAGAIALIALGGYLCLARRDHAITDATAARLDDAAALGGELRSASWFAARESASDWVDFHVATAAERLQSVDWARLYPPVPATRQKAITAVLAVVAIALTLPAAGRSGVQATGSRPTAAERARAALGLDLPEDVRRQLEELLRRAEASSLINAGRPLTEAEVRALLARLADSPDLKNAKDSDKNPDASGTQMQKSADDLKSLAERAARASEMASLSPEVRDALSEVADTLTEKSEQASRQKDAKDSKGAVEGQKADAAQSNKPGEKQDASLQAVKDSNAGGGVGVVMMSSEDPKGAQEAGLGLGGASADRNGGGHMPDIAAALRKETIDAYKEDTGDKNDQDLRRKTAQGSATVKFSASSPGAFEKGRATAPPAVPETRRTAVQTYFIRKQ